MTLRRSFRPLRPDLDKFLFAAVGDEIDGIPLSMISALTRLGLDPWQEACRLSSLSSRTSPTLGEQVLALATGKSSALFACPCLATFLDQQPEACE
jgi:hypothetical protein